MLALTPVSKYQKEASRNNKNKKPDTVKIDPHDSLPPDQIILDQNSQQQPMSYLKKDQKTQYENRLFQNSHLTRFIHQKTKTLQQAMMLFAILSIILSLISQEIIDSHMQQLMALGMHSLITGILIFLLIWKYRLRTALYKAQLIKRSRLDTWKALYCLVIEFLFLLLHPNILTKNVIYYIPQPIYNSTIPRAMNDSFEILMMFRIYLVYRALVYDSLYCTTRASRICRIYGTKNSIIFGAKALFDRNPLGVLITLFVTLTIIYSQMLFLSEKQINQSFKNFNNSIWCIVITMGTIGYGDVFPTTYMGRGITFMAALSGIIMSSLLIITLSAYLTMNFSQMKSHITLHRLILREMLEQHAKDVVLHTSSLIKQTSVGRSILQKRRQKGNAQSSEKQKAQKKQILQQIKAKTQKVNFTIRRIKNMVDKDNLRQQMNRLFDVLSDNLKQTYLNQLQYRKLLLQLYNLQKDRIKKLRLSFTTEIQQIIKDR